MHVQNSNSKISAHPDLANQLGQILIYQLHLVAYCVKKFDLHFNHVLGNVLSEKSLVITPMKSKLNILHTRISCLPKRKVSRILPVQKIGWAACSFSHSVFISCTMIIALNVIAPPGVLVCNYSYSPVACSFSLMVQFHA